MSSNPGQIPAGGKEKISVLVKTKGKGGRLLRKRFRVESNDPEKPKTELTIFGKVNGYVGIQPKYVRLMGSVEDDKLQAVVNIKPEKNFPLSIKSIKANKGENIELNLEPVGKTPKKDGYRIIVMNKKKDAGTYNDLILIETDLKQKSVLRIPVSGRILEKKKQTDSSEKK
ncbi:MAG: hypothetical protein GY874_11635 [Desulfobacteraceae bacterium]|nr:hypothetical protein [Desulfobacteraceae bacterium]